MQLVDLSAWGAFKDENILLFMENGLLRFFDPLRRDNIYFMKSSDVFLEIQHVIDQQITSKFKETFKKPFLMNASAGFKDTGLTVGRGFQKKCPLLLTKFRRTL